MHHDLVLDMTVSLAHDLYSGYSCPFVVNELHESYVVPYAEHRGPAVQIVECIPENHICKFPWEYLNTPFSLMLQIWEDKRTV